MDRIKLLYTTADGRLSRKDWWIGVIGLIIASLVLTSILALVGLGGPYGWGQLIAYVILFYPGWCIGIKRRQDRDNNGTDFKVLMGLSGLLTLLQALGIGVNMVDVGNGTFMPMPDMWLSLLFLLMGVFGIYMLVQLGFLRGTPGPNNYGPDPLVYAATA
jgi:uncharacterized membrane protein YhaH (DUF805 family)